MNDLTSRRQFLRFLAASPLATVPSGFSWAYPERAVPENLRQVLNVFQLDRAARLALPPDVYHFIVDAADDGDTKRANREAYTEVSLRPRRLVDVSNVDTSVELFGRTYRSPILLAPVGAQGRIHPEGEMATARAAAAKKHLMICSQMTNASIADISGAGGQYWFQLYPSRNRDFMRKLMDDAAAAGCDTIALTVDGPTRGNHEASRWLNLTRDKSVKRERMALGNFAGFGGPVGIGDRTLNWDDLAWFRENTELNFGLKPHFVTKQVVIRTIQGVIDRVIRHVNHRYRA